MAYFCLSLQESNFTEMAAFKERNWFSYVDVTKITVRIYSVILVKSEALNLSVSNHGQCPSGLFYNQGTFSKIT